MLVYLPNINPVWQLNFILIPLFGKKFIVCLYEYFNKIMKLYLNRIAE